MIMSILHDDNKQGNGKNIPLKPSIAYNLQYGANDTNLTYARSSIPYFKQRFQF